MRKTFGSRNPSGFVEEVFFPILSLVVIFLPLPILILASVNLSWLTHLPSPLKQSVLQEAFGAGFLRTAVAAVLGGFFWVNMFLVTFLVCPFFVTDRRVKPFLIAAWVVLSIIACAVSWIVYLAKAPWRPESKVPVDILSEATVKAGCRQILALKCLITIHLSLMATWLVIMVLEGLGDFDGQIQTQTQPRPRMMDLNKHTAEDGAVSQVRKADKGNQEGMQAEARQKDVERGEFGIPDGEKEDRMSMAVMDGAG